MKITEQELATRKKRIIYTAYELFCERGIDSVPLKKVAEKAGVSLNSIFRYFETKTELLHCTQRILWQEIMAQILSDSEGLLLATANGFEEMRILLQNFRKLYEKHSDYLLFAYEYKLYLVRQHIKLPPQQYLQLQLPVYEAFCAALKRGQEDGTITDQNPIEKQFYILWGIMRGFVEEVVVFDRIYGGENFWKDPFELVLDRLLGALRGDCRT